MGTLNNMRTFIRCFLGGVFLAALSFGQAQTVYIPQLADGGTWQTTLVVTNTSTVTVPISMTFYVDAGGSPFTFIEQTPVSVPAGSTVLLHTPGTAASTTTGWGAITVGSSTIPGGGVNVYAIFAQTVAGKQEQDGTAVATPASNRFLIPFDQTNGAVVGFAIANTSTSAATVNVAVRTANGTVTQGTLSIAAQAHYSFALNDPSSPLQGAIAAAMAGTSGLAEFYSTSDNLSVLTLRFNATLAFTAAPVYVEAGAPIIGTVQGTYPAPFSSLFVGGNWILSGSSGSILMVIAPSSNGTYTALVLEQTPSLDITFQNGTLTGQTLSFTSVKSGSYAGATVTSGSLNLTIGDFTDPGSPVTGTLTVNTTTGSINANSTYLP
jgi:hypothetical protein